MREVKKACILCLDYTILEAELLDLSKWLGRVNMPPIFFHFSRQKWFVLCLCWTFATEGQAIYLWYLKFRLKQNQILVLFAYNILHPTHMQFKMYTFSGWGSEVFGHYCQDETVSFILMCMWKDYLVYVHQHVVLFVKSSTKMRKCLHRYMK